MSAFKKSMIQGQREKKVSACCSKVMNLFLISTHDDVGMCHVLAKSNITPWC